MKITDIHTHSFPDNLAERAMKKLVEEVKEEDVRAYHDGKVSSLLASMDRAGIGRSVLCSIATKPEQFDPILKWSRQIASDRIVPFPSVHPRDPEAVSRLTRVKEAGFKGIKLHPYYQDFFLDEEAALPLYQCASDIGLIIVCHTGFDIAFPRVRRADPERIANVMRQFPKLKLITTHLGAWQDWDHVRRFLLGKPIYMEISYSLGQLPDEQVRDILLQHPQDCLLFGTDSPWQDQSETLRRLRSLNLGEQRERAMLCDNAARLLDGSDHST
jgi:predicted TIM-barrel fold metal-dependent hydrolase